MRATGLSVEFRRGLEERGEAYVVGVTGQEAVFRRATHLGSARRGTSRAVDRPLAGT